jgi:hypothetical protein
MTMPPATLTLDEERERFYAALGKAITQWQEVEAAISRLFQDAMGIDAFWPASVSFHAVMSFEIRLDMTNAALQAIRGQLFMDSWRPLYAKCSKRYKRRNQLAHFHLFADEMRRSGYRLHLAPSIFDGRAIQRWQNKAPRFNGCQIIAIGNSFSTLATSLTRLLLIPRRQVETRIVASPEPEAHPRQEPLTEDAPSDRALEAPPEPSRE